MRQIVAGLALLALAGCDSTRDLIIEADGPWSGHVTGHTPIQYLSGDAGVHRHSLPESGPRCFLINALDGGTVRVRVEGVAEPLAVHEELPAVAEGPQARGCVK